MAEEKTAKDAVFHLCLTDNVLEKYTSIQTLDDFILAAKNSKFLISEHRETEDKKKHLHLFFFLPYAQKKKREITDELMKLNIFTADRQTLESFVIGSIIKIEKTTYPNVCKLMIERSNSVSLVPRDCHGAKSVFFQQFYRANDHFRKKVLDGTNKNLDDNCCMSLFSSSDRQRNQLMVCYTKERVDDTSERDAIFDRIRSTQRAKFENYSSLLRLVRLVKAKSPSHFELLITENERMTVFCGIPNYESILEEVFRNIEITDLQIMNGKNYIEKLCFNFLNFYETSLKFNTLEPQIQWLQVNREESLTLITTAS